MPAPDLLYTRDLPGGGYVAVDVRPAGEADPAPRARLWVERRADPTRRAGHAPPVIVRSAAEELEHAVAELRAIAADNVALAQAMRCWARDSGPPAPPA